MPADTKAIAYEWFMTMDESAQLVKIRWEPEGEFLSSMSMGWLQPLTRNTIGGETEWKPIHGAEGTLKMNCPWVVAESYARREGFEVEVPIYPGEERSES
jgi:hypothetical protein